MKDRVGTPNGKFIRTVGNIGIVASAAIAVGAIVAFVAQFAWGVATRPIVTELREEKSRAMMADSLMLVELRHLNEGFTVLADALQYEPGSAGRARALRSARRAGPGY